MITSTNHEHLVGQAFPAAHLSRLIPTHPEGRGRDFLAVWGLDRMTSGYAQAGTIQTVRADPGVGGRHYLAGSGDEADIAEVNPDPINGCWYLMWPEGRSVEHSPSFWEYAGNRWHTWGRADSPDALTRRRPPMTVPGYWVLIRDPRREVGPHVVAGLADGLRGAVPEDVQTSLRAAIRDLEGFWDTWSEAMNTHARSRGWCSEYEETVQPLGFPGRAEDEEVDWNVRVSVELETDVFVNSEVRRALEDWPGIVNIEGVSSVRVTWTTSVSGTVAATSADDARDAVDSDWIASVMEGYGISGDIEDYSVEEIEAS